METRPAIGDIVGRAAIFLPITFSCTLMGVCVCGSGCVNVLRPSVDGRLVRQRKNDDSNGENAIDNTSHVMASISKCNLIRRNQLLSARWRNLSQIIEGLTVKYLLQIKGWVY